MKPKPKFTMSILRTQCGGVAFPGGTALPLAEWNEGEPFAVTVKQQSGLAVRTKLKRITYAELVAGIPGRGVAGRLAGL